MLLNIDEIYTTIKNGNLKITKYVNALEVHVTFLSTGYKRVTSSARIREGQVKDMLLPRIYGVGFIGGTQYTANVNGVKTRAYSIWHSMLQRCYCPVRLELEPYYKGCTVAVDWHNFQTFCKWYEENYIEGYELDKDIKVEGNRIYSEEFCTFVTQAENATKANARRFIFKNPEGEKVEIYNLSEHSRTFKLDRSTMSSVHSGKRKSHKGWTKHG